MIDPKPKAPFSENVSALTILKKLKNKISIQMSRFLMITISSKYL